jgi:hypothetical protein
LFSANRDILFTFTTIQAAHADHGAPCPYARTLRLADLVSEGKGASADADGLRGPAYLLLSQEEGGFARFGFWLEKGGSARYLAAGYVDLVVDDDDVESGALTPQG